MWTTMAATMGLLVVAFFIWGSYTQRSTLSGRLMPSTGLVRVHVPQSGVVVRLMVEEGQTVKQGQPLFEVSSDRQTDARTGSDGTQATVSARVRQRSDSIQAQINQTRALQAEERSALATRLALLKSQLGTLDAQIASQKQRTAIASEAEARTASLVAQGFYSKEQAQLKQAEVLDQRVKLQDLVRQREQIEQEIQTRADEQRSMPLRHQSQMAELDRSRLGVEQELVESESRRQLVIVAPQAGVVTSIVAEAGQTVDPSRAVLSIVPAGAQLQAHLYAPSSAIGFIRDGDEVRLRYAAFPYQKFGQAKGVVSAISKTAIPASELMALGLIPEAPTATAEPLYRVTVALQSQTIKALGKTWPLQVSMAAEADVMRENRRLYEWVLEPLYGISGKI
jgi:membrane fusion protein